MDLDQPIIPTYSKPRAEFLESLKRGSACVEIKQEPRLLLARTYFGMGIQGALEKVFLRARVYDAIKDALKLLPPSYGFVIFDAFRTKETQKGLFEAYSSQIAAKYPDWTSDQLYAETRKFVAHPNEPSRFEVPPHNSGGAVDLGLIIDGKSADMGTPFDDLTNRAETSFFEETFDPGAGLIESRWLEIRRNRRILFHSMREAGFTNWKFEWWHFDLGNCVWSQELGIPWIYDSMMP